MTYRIAPDELVTFVNFFGDHEDVDDDPDSPDGNWMTAGLPLFICSATLGFATPFVPPEAGAGRQEIRMWIRRAAVATDSDVNIDVIDGATTLASANHVFADGDPLILSVTWDAADLEDATGAGVVVKLENSADKHSFDIGAVEWNGALLSIPTYYPMVPVVRSWNADT